MKVLLVEDDKKISEILADGFRAEGYLPEVAKDGESGLQRALTKSFDLLVVDVMLPVRDGFSLVEELRRQEVDTPVLFLSAKRSTEDRIEGLRLGGDDYIVKPFSLSEVLVRAEAILRRTSRQAEGQRLKYDELEINLLARTVTRQGKPIELHPKEFSLLECLVRNRDKVLSKTQILDKVWNYDFDPQTNVVDVLVCRLRNKIDRDFKKKLIKTIRGVGYAIRKD